MRNKLIGFSLMKSATIQSSLSLPNLVDQVISGVMELYLIKVA